MKATDLETFKEYFQWKAQLLNTMDSKKLLDTKMHFIALG
jgi:hypothetical protein